MANPKVLTKIYSQASNDVTIPTYKNREDKKTSAPHVIESVVIIRGGANVAYGADIKSDKNPKWSITEVTDNELKTLKDHPGFMRRVKKGFITIGKEPESLKADKSAQLSKADLEKKAPNAKPKTGSSDK